MKITLLIAMISLTGCSLFTDPYSHEPPPALKNKSVVLTIKINEDLSRFGIMGDTASSCSIDGICTLYLPELGHVLDSHGWCTYGVMLGRAIFGKREKEGGECAGY